MYEMNVAFEIEISIQALKAKIARENNNVETVPPLFAGHMGTPRQQLIAQGICAF
jgi:hypothetical protein